MSVPRHYQPSQMRIAEIFYSIQGEGKLAGLPSVFIRTSGCNLRCVWCDTPYASWNPEGEDLDIATILATAAKYPARHCVITGGEPMVARGIHELAGQLQANGYHVTIESAATIAPNAISCDLASLSPKLANSTPSSDTAGQAWSNRHENDRINSSALREWLNNYQYQLKFVISELSQIDEIHRLLAATGCRVDHGDILLMPEATSSSQLDNLAPQLARLCMQQGFRYCDRLHIRLFGNTKGT